MKILLVDDERHVRESIRLLLERYSLGIKMILEASDGEEAIAIVKEYHPQIILTDMIMPIKNGSALLEWVNIHSPASKMVIISGHDDFDLIRHSMQHGGSDYILKPIDAEELSEAIEKAISTWHKEESLRQNQLKYQKEIQQIKPVYWEKIFSQLIAEPTYFTSVRPSLEQEFGFDAKIENSLVAVLSLHTLSSVVIERFGKHRDLLYFALINIINEILRSEQVGYAFRYWNSDHEIIVLLWKKLDNIQNLLKKINDIFVWTLHDRFVFGVGKIHAFPTELNDSYNEAKSAISHRNLLKKNVWIHYITDTSVAIPSLQLADYENEFYIAICCGVPQTLDNILDKWLSEVAKLSHISPRHLEIWGHEYQVMTNRWWTGDEKTNRSSLTRTFPSGLLLPESGELSFDAWKKQWKIDLTELSRCLILENRKKIENTIYDIIHYVEANYKLPLTLADISTRFFLSREYISRKFKQEFNQNFSVYLTQIRMDKAKALLQNPQYKMGEIAEMVGFQDEKYFSKVFKKTISMTPNEYRKSQKIRLRSR